MNPYNFRDNESLAELLTKIATDIRAFSPSDRAAILTAAATRLDGRPMPIVVRLDGSTVNEGDVIEDFHGEQWRFVGIDALPSGPSQGRIAVTLKGRSKMRSAFYPSVFDLKITTKENQ